MNKRYAIFLLTILSIGCQPKKQDEQTTVDSTNMLAPQPSSAAQLTEAQKTEGWKLLFDGESLNGWRFFKDIPNDSWEVTAGTLHCKPAAESKKNLRGDIMTVDAYENFELAFDWKMSPHGNSGVMYRVTEAYDQPYRTGPEYQLLDDGGYPGETKEKNMTACVYDMYEAPGKKMNPTGEWNTSKIIVNGNQVEHWLNDKKVVTYELNSPDWEKRKAISKWKDEPGFGMAKKGHIDLQDHGHEIWFKNIMIKLL